MSESNDLTKISFTGIKEDLKNHLKNQDRFKDYDFDGSNMAVLLDVLAYNTFQNNFYNNMVMSEMFIDTAQTKNAILSHAKELNYLPQSRRSAQAMVKVRFNAGNAPDFITVPEGTVFTARCGSKTFEFVTDEAQTVTPVGTVYEKTFPILEGSVVTEYFAVSKKNAQYKISNPNVDISSIRVSVSGSRQLATDGQGEEYMMLESLHGANDDSKVFYLQIKEDDCYQVEFGRGVFGVEPTVGQVIAVRYRVTNGEASNGAAAFVMRDTIAGYPSTVTTVSKAEGGSEREQLESIRFFAPKALQIQDRAVTERDYELLLKQKYPEIQAVSVYGGEEATPPQYGRVIVAVDVKNGDGVSDSLKQKYVTFLKDRTPLAIEPIIISPKFMFVNIDTTVFYDNRETALSAAEIKSLVKNRIVKFSQETLNNFKTTFRYSKLITTIDDTHASILSNNTTARAIVEVVPFEGKFMNTYINFGNRIIREPIVNTNNYDTNRTPGLVSSTFRYNSRNCFIRDNGNGGLQIVTVTNGNVTVINNAIGEVNYKTGYVRVKSFAVQSYTGPGISFYATTYMKDFSSPKDRILAIRDSDITVEVKWVN